MSAAEHIWVVIPAAGSSRRMGAIDRPKQYLPLCGRTLLEWAVQPLLSLPACERIVVVLAADDRHWQWTSLNREPRIGTALGGQERADSVRAGLAALSDTARENDWVLVHDAARPCLSKQDVDELVMRLRSDPVGGLLATPVVDTLKRADENNSVIETLPREGLWRALTPQMFRFGVLERALVEAARDGIAVTDEAQAVERLGLRPKLIRGSAENIKVTTPADFDQAARILTARGER